MKNTIAAVCGVLYVAGIVGFCWLLVGGAR